jgi:AraC family transcriptional regulator, melibiose operon regulatory protein
MLRKTLADSSSRKTTQKAEAASKAFGRFGMRIFLPKVMDQPHSHSHVEVNYIRNARLHYLVDGRSVVVDSDTFIVFWANVPHQLIAVEASGTAPAKLSNIYVPLDTFLFMHHIQELQVQILNGAMIIVPGELYSQETLQRWYEDYCSHSLDRIEIVLLEINALFRRMLFRPLAFLRQPWREFALTSDTAAGHIHHVVEMVGFILDNLEKPLTNTAISKVTGLHSNYAHLLFSKTMKITPKQFIIRMRLLRARSLLLEGKMPIASVAFECGFNSMTQFYEHFSNAYGTTPLTLRKKSFGREMLVQK